MNLPQALADQLQKRSGLICLSIGRNSEPQNLLEALIEKAQQQQQSSRRSLLIQREDLRKDQIQHRTSILNYNQLGTAPVRDLLLKSDIIFMEDIVTLEELELALYLSEAGCLVVTHWLSRSVMMTLQRILSWLGSVQREPFFWRLSESLQFLGSFHLIKGTDGNKLNAWELCLMNSDLRRIIRAGDVSQFEKTITTEPNKPTGTVSLNQSLLQLIVQRNIDIKSAFDASLDPEDLDRLMKKVGI